jgi:hypothetical protein
VTTREACELLVDKTREVAAERAKCAIWEMVAQRAVSRSTDLYLENVRLRRQLSALREELRLIRAQVRTGCDPVSVTAASGRSLLPETSTRTCDIANNTGGECGISPAVIAEYQLNCASEPVFPPDGGRFV